jgi:hypothetical protein
MNSAMRIIHLFLLLTIIPTSRAVAQKFFRPQFSQAQNDLLDKVQLQTFNYFWEAGEPVSGCARERFHMDNEYPFHDKDIVTMGGTGFGIMATIVAVHRGFINRGDAVLRLEKLTEWLNKAERYHGAWSHWYTPDGKTFPFSKYDNGGDIVETAFLAQAFLVARQYFQYGNSREQLLADTFDGLWRTIDWKWYTQGENVIYWHWSPDYDFKMDFDIRGHNECLILYVLAASSQEFATGKKVFHEGYMNGGKVYTDRKYYGLDLVLDHYETNDMPVGPLFWAHYSHLGLDPRGLKNDHADFWLANKNHALVHYYHAVQNPYGYKGYGEDCWGLTSSYSMQGYAGHNPTEDLGVISPTAALSSFPYTPTESMRFLEFLYEQHPEMIGEYGPYDAFSFESNWYVQRYLAIDQLPIPGMIENFRSGLLWNLFMSAPEIQKGLDKLGLEYKKVKAN